MKKEKYLEIAQGTLSFVFSKASARETIDVMAKLKLSTVTDVDTNLINEFNTILYKRIRILKGEGAANSFLKSINAECQLN
jgi:hypothetical protein